MPRCRYSTFAAVAFTDDPRLPGGYCRSYMTVKEEKWAIRRRASANYAGSCSGIYVLRNGIIVNWEIGAKAS
jgi:hypothetical protein